MSTSPPRGGPPTPPSVGASLASKVSDLVKTVEKLGKSFERAIASLNKTQKEFGLTITNAAKLQASILVSTVKDTTNILQNIDYSAAFEGLKDIGSGLFDVIKNLFSGEGIAGGADAFKKTIDKLTEPIPGKSLDQVLLSSERLEGIKSVQEEFGVINQKFGSDLAQYAKNQGVSVQQLVQSIRAFSTITRGNLDSVNRIQTRFFEVFSARGLTPKVALEAITKYAELIARNGTRFADSFARAAADAKKIGVDLGKVEQVGDNIIDNFEGFLESQAELGAMGFGFDTSRLAMLAETGDTGTLFNELRSQLAGMGKDITTLRRSERLALESAFGINISELQRLAGGTPEIAPEELQKDSNTKLGQLLALIGVLGPVFSMAGSLGDIGKALGVGVAGMTVAASAYGIYKAYVEGAKLKEQAIKDIQEGRTGAGLTKGAAGGALQGTAVGALLGIPLGLGMMATGVGVLPGIATIATSLGVGATGGAMYGMSDVYQQGAANRTAIELEAQRKRAEEQEASKRYMQQFYPRPGMATPNTIDNNLLNALRTQGVVGKASGGFVSGPGTETSDSIPARLSNGEYVLNAKAVSLLGVDTLDKLNNVQKFATGGLVGSVGEMFQSRGLSNLLSGMNKLSSFGDQFAQSVEGLTSKSGLLGKFESLKNFNLGEKINTGLGGLMNKFSQTKMSGLFEKAKGLFGGGTDGLKEKAMGLASKIPGVGSLLSGGFGGLKDKALGAITSKIPGVGGIISSLTSGGGIKGALSSLASAGAGKAIGGGLGTLIPIPGVGTALGSIAGSFVGKGVGKLAQSNVGKSIGKVAKYTPIGLAASGISKLFGKKKSSQAAPSTPSMEMVGTDKISTFMPDVMSQLQMSGQSVVSPNVSVDTSGIEQKLNNFISALNNMNIVMDGAKVGKVLVNTSDAANTMGVFRPTTRATL